MPFDNTGKPIITTQDVSALLRDRSRWPSDFKWDYSGCATCAMGLVQEYFGVDLGVHDKDMIPYAMAKRTGDLIGISLKYAERIFVNLPYHVFKKEYSSITPEDVADAIDALINTQQEKSDAV